MGGPLGYAPGRRAIPANEGNIALTAFVADSALGSATVSDPLVRFAMWTAATVLVLAAMVVVQIALIRFRTLLRTRREARFVVRWRPLLLEAVDTLPAHLPRVRRPDQFIFLSMWNHFQESLRGPARHRLKALALRLRMDVAARDMLRTGGVRERLIALLTLGHLGDHDSWPSLERLARERHALLSLAAARAMLLTDVARAMPLLLPLMTRRLDWPLPRLKVILAEAGRLAIARPMIDAAESALSDELPRLIPLLDVCPGDSVQPLLKRLLQTSQDIEALIACLKSRHLAPDRSPILRLLKHRAWQVRTQAARVMGRVAMIEDLPVLVRLLSDPVWWVRYRAAQSIAQLPFVGSDGLWQIREKLADRFARDILDQVVAEGPGR